MNVREAFGLTGSEIKAETMINPAREAGFKRIQVKAFRWRNAQTKLFPYSVIRIAEVPDIRSKVDRRIPLAELYFKKYDKDIDD